MKRTNKCAIVALVTTLTLFTSVFSQSTSTSRRQPEQSRTSAVAPHGNADYISEAVNQSYLRLTFNYRFDDPQDSSQLFFRSDHYTYAEKGIPIIFYYGGEHEDYHQPSDSPDKIDYYNMEKVTRTVHATAWELANRERRPRVDKPLQ